MNPYTPPSTIDPTKPETPTPRMTGAAFTQGFKNALICAVPVLAISGLVYWCVSTFTASSRITALFSAFMIPLAVSLFAMLTTWVRGIQSRGDMVLDCGKHPGRWLFVFNAVIFLILGLGGFAFGAIGTVFTILSAVYWLFMATGRLSVHQAGLWTYHTLLPWDKISHYSWASGNTLVIKTTNVLSLSRGAIPVPVECVAGVQRLLEEHKSQAT